MATLQSKLPAKSRKAISPAEALANMARCQNDPDYFVREILDGSPYLYQTNVLSDIGNPLSNRARVVWHKAHGVGGTTTMAWAALWFLFTRPNSRVVTTASVNRQVRDILWPEIHRWARRAKENLWKIGWKWPFNSLDTKLEISQEWFAIGASSDTAENMEGFHADHLLYIVDEAKTVSKEIFEAIEGAMTGQTEAKLLVVSTPQLSKTGHFYEICSGRFPGWVIHHTRAADSPNVSPEWIEQKRIEWGETSPVYISKVLGEFPDAAEDTLIPLGWIELAEKRWLEHKSKMEKMDSNLVDDNDPEYPELSTYYNSHIHTRSSLGVDVARYGDDETVIARKRRSIIEELKFYTKQDTMQTAGRVVNAITTSNASRVFIDSIGVGAGVYDRVREVIKDNEDIDCSVRSVNVSKKAPLIYYKGEKIKFKRMRDFLYWNLRMLLDPVNCPADDLVALPPDHKLRKQLAGIRYKIASDGAVEMHSKDQMKRDGFDSPDRAEAVMMACTKMNEGWATILKDD